MAAESSWTPNAQGGECRPALRSAETASSRGETRDEETRDIKNDGKKDSRQEVVDAAAGSSP